MGIGSIHAFACALVSLVKFFTIEFSSLRANVSFTFSNENIDKSNMPASVSGEYFIAYGLK